MLSAGASIGPGTLFLASISMQRLSRAAIAILQTQRHKAPRDYEQQRRLPSLIPIEKAHPAPSGRRAILQIARRRQFSLDFAYVSREQFHKRVGLAR